LYDPEVLEARYVQADETEDKTDSNDDDMQAWAEMDDEGDRARFPRAASDKLTLEMAIFFDEAAYRMFAPFLNNDEAQMRDMLLAYMNAVSMHEYNMEHIYLHYHFMCDRFKHFTYIQVWVVTLH
jgi:hypothetical protein